MSNNRDAPQSTAEPPATNTTQHELALPGTEAQSTSPKLDATLNGLHEIHKNDRSNGEDLATEAGFTTRGNPGRSGEGADGNSKPQNDSVVGASTVLKMDAQSKHSDIETELSTTEDELDSDDDDAVSVVDSQDSRGRRHQIKYTPRPMKKTLKQRTEMASKRLAVQAKYAKLVEDRLADVEKRLKEVENQRSKKIEVEDETEADPASSESRVPSPTPEPKKRYTQVLGINRVGFEHYKPKKSLDPKPEYLPDGGHRFGPTPVPDLPQRHVIDVVIPHTSIGEAPQSNTGIRPSVFLTAAGVSHEDAAAEGLALPDMQSVVPERIRINSSLLLDVLEYVTGCKFTRLDIDGHEGELKTQAFLRPFKMLVTYEHEIRKHVRDLEEKLALLHAKASTPISTVEANRELSPELIATEKAGSDPEGASGSKNPRSEVLAARSSEDSTTAAEGNIEEFERRLQELHALVEVIDIDLKPVFDLRRRIQEVEIRSISFGDLWHLFRIGKEVRTNQGGTSQVYRIVDISGGRPALCTRADATFGPLEPGIEANDHTIFTISCFCYGFNGRHLGPIQRIFDIQKYDDPKPITSLPVYPVEFSGIEDGDLTREDFVLRGKKFVQLTRDESSVVHKRYHGLSMNLEQLREEIDSEVIVDTSMAFLKNPSIDIDFGITERLETDVRETLEFVDPDGCKAEGCHQNTATHKDYEVDKARSDSVLQIARSYRNLADSADSMQPEDLLICPCMVYGYVLRSRKWVSLDVGLVEDIAIQELGFDSLVLPKGHSETLLALVETHSKGAKPATGQKVVERQIDLVRGKGKGLIILLHGEPGVGKTSTAECVAEYTKRPLFQVTCGDIGSSAGEVERTLENHFQLAHKWGCVLLLDEADVFLMARSRQDLKRNAIVSVFLRVLEYYSGILFLTTNRVGTFDPAFRSRIHMSFFYPKLDLKTTLKIWTMNLDRTRKMWAENIEIDPQERDRILAFAEEHFKDSEKVKTTWNGRQIRNAFQTAIALAEYEIHKAQKRFKMKEEPVPRLEAWQFEKVAEASKHFDEYLKATVGLEEDRARENFERRDDLVFDR